MKNLPVRFLFFRARVFLALVLISLLVYLVWYALA
jgi:hypothetical protein